MGPAALTVVCTLAAQAAAPAPTVANPAPAVTPAPTDPARQAPLVAVRPGAESSCPTPVAVEAALLARVPGVVVSFDRAAERGALVLGLSSSDAGAEMTLSDPGGQLRLRRALTGAGEKQDCAALAETAALIVERYLVELDERAAAAARAAQPSPSIVPLITRVDRPPWWWVGLGAGHLIGDFAPGDFEVGLRVGRVVGDTGNWTGQVRIGVGPAFDPVPATARYDGRASVRRVPIEAGLYRRTWLFGSVLELGAGLGLDVHRVKVRARGTEALEHLLGPNVFAEAAARRALTRQVDFRIAFGLVGHPIGYQFFRTDAPSGNGVRLEPVFSLPTRRIQVRLALELGLSLPLTKTWSARP